jgi:hypothetical protein
MKAESDTKATRVHPVCGTVGELLVLCCVRQKSMFDGAGVVACGLGVLGIGVAQ